MRAGELIGRWWDGRFGRLALRDFWLYRTTTWRVESREGDATVVGEIPVLTTTRTRHAPCQVPTRHRWGRLGPTEILAGRRVAVRVDQQTLMFFDPETRDLLRVRPNR